MARGQLVPDDVTVRIIEKRLNSPEAQKGFVLDGFPRNLAQAEALKSILEEKGQHLDLVIDLVVPQDELLERSRTRRVCSKCGRSYNLKLNPPKVCLIYTSADERHHHSPRSHRRVWCRESRCV